VVGGGSAGLAAGEQVAQERLEVAAGGGLKAGATLPQEGVGLPYRDEIGGDRAG
jgi:ribulose 1,5-bisphosphate synthetase/thiazole synthase